MPNHVRNHLTIDGPEESLRRMVTKILDSERCIDFELLVPMPAELKGVSSGMTTIDGKRYELWRDTEAGPVGLGAEEIAELTRKYGTASWYDWACVNWGTKWNAYECTVHEAPKPNSTGGDAYMIDVEFDTAWSHPEYWLQALAKEFPDCRINVHCSGEVDRPYKVHYN